MKRDPEVVTLYFRTAEHMFDPTPSSPSSPQEGLKRRAYRIARKEEFITILQENLKRFK
jgi:hypothetical protein